MREQRHHGTRLGRTRFGTVRSEITRWIASALRIQLPHPTWWTRKSDRNCARDITNWNVPRHLSASNVEINKVSLQLSGTLRGTLHPQRVCKMLQFRTCDNLRFLPCPEPVWHRHLRNCSERTASVKPCALARLPKMLDLSEDRRIRARFSPTRLVLEHTPFSVSTMPPRTRNTCFRLTTDTREPP